VQENALAIETAGSPIVPELKRVKLNCKQQKKISK